MSPPYAVDQGIEAGTDIRLGANGIDADIRTACGSLGKGKTLWDGVDSDNPFRT
jgi:hypothetical protein